MVTAIAQAVGAIANTVSSFKNASAQRYNLNKGMEADAVRFEQNKTLAAYSGVSSTRQITMISIVVLIVAIIVYIAITKKK